MIFHRCISLSPLSSLAPWLLIDPSLTGISSELQRSLIPGVIHKLQVRRPYKTLPDISSHSILSSTADPHLQELLCFWYEGWANVPFASHVVLGGMQWRSVRALFLLSLRPNLHRCWAHLFAIEKESRAEYFQRCYTCPSLRWSLKLLQFLLPVTTFSFELGHVQHRL